MASLILAGESIFLPAFHLGRYFKSPLLRTYGIDEFQLGQLGFIYGVCASACYFLGGPLADRWSPRNLLSISLVVTALGSFYMATTPSFGGLCLLYGFWGVSTILAFWAPLIRATRESAGDDAQGVAFGVLDGGRGLAAALIATIAAFAFAVMVGDDAINNPTYEAAAMRKLVCAYGGNCLLAALCVWLFVPESQLVAGSVENEAQKKKEGSIRHLVPVLRSPAIWLQAVVIIAAYSAFKMMDNYGLYSEDAYGITPTASARLMARISFVRVGAALGAGWIADRLFGVRVTIQICFGMLIAAYVAFIFVMPDSTLVWLMIMNMVVSSVGFFALRGIYFALLEESGTPRNLTGTAVGVISFIGFTPEIYMGPLTGWLIRDARVNGNVLLGYHRIFWILLVLSVCGLLAAWALRWFRPRPPEVD